MSVIVIIFNMAAGIKLVDYLFWSLRLCVRWLLYPFRLLVHTRLDGFSLLVLITLFMGLITLNGLKRTIYKHAMSSRDTFANKTENQRQESQQRKPPASPSLSHSNLPTHLLHPEIQLTVREPDRLTVKFVEKIYPDLSQEEQTQLMYELHRNPYKLLSARDREEGILNNYHQHKWPRSTNPDTVLCVKSPHTAMRLGNLLFLYASSYALSQDTGRKLVEADNVFQTLRKTFPEIPRHQQTAEGANNDIGSIIPITHAAYEKLPLPADDVNEDVCLSGFLQSWKYFYHHQNTIKKHLTFSDTTISLVKTAMKKAIHKIASVQGVMDKDIVVVGVHVRRGDMLSADSRQQGYQVPGEKYFYKAMLYYYIHYHHVHFLIVSDDPRWVRDTFQDLFRVVTWEYVDDGGKEYNLASTEHLALLSLCDHVIGSVGSYSWWGGWLAGGTVLMYDEPYKQASVLAQGYNVRDFFMPHWKLLDDK